MIEINLSDYIISFNGRVFEIFYLCQAYEPRFYHYAQLKKIEIITDKKGRHKLDVDFIFIHNITGPQIYISDDKISQVEELINAINEAKAAR